METPERTRTLEDVNRMLKHAKFEENQILPTSQAIYFNKTNVHENDYRLIQLDSYLLNKIQTGDTLRIIGDDNENAVLCSESRTYNLIETETSNSLLLTDNVNFLDDIKQRETRNISQSSVLAIFHDYIEVSPTKPKLKKLRSLLEKTAYEGPELEYLKADDELMTIEDLSDTIQASKLELEAALKALNAVTIDDKVRVLDFNYHFRVLSLMLKLIDENSWPMDEIRYDGTVEALGEIVPERILESVFNLYAEESKTLDGEQLYRYDEEKVGRLFARVLLGGREKIELKGFVEAWGRIVPEGMVVRVETLGGIAIIDRLRDLIWGCPEEELPEDVSERLSVLFEEKPKWTLAEITPYIRNLTTDKMDVNALLAKYARSFTTDGVKCYCAKHGR